MLPKRFTSSRRSYGRLSFVSATWPGRAATMYTGATEAAQYAVESSERTTAPSGSASSRSTSPGVSGEGSYGAVSQWPKPKIATGKTNAPATAADSGPRSSRVPLLPSTAATTSATAPPASATQAAIGGPPSSRRYANSPGYASSSAIPAASAAGIAHHDASRASTAAPPANAAASGTKPAARRACDSDTASENGVKSCGMRRIASIATAPPSTYADQRLRDANAASGTTRSAAMATAPARPSISGARRKLSAEKTSTWPG